VKASPEKPEKEWSERWWGKLLLGGGSVLVALFVYKMVSVANDVAEIPAMKTRIKVLELQAARMKQRTDYDSIRVVLLREQKEESRQRSERFDSSLIEGDRRFDKALIRKLK